MPAVPAPLRLHFTVSPEHDAAFRAELARGAPAL